ncbi:MAG: hypothetical protein ACI4JB_06725 [Porcipelethomonas sp.]
MSDNYKDLIALNCPNCQATLSCKSNEMTVTCEHCGTSILIKDLITKSRIDKADKLESSSAMAENALKNKDWKSAYKYYESICKIEQSPENMAIFNILAYICDKIGYQETIFDNSKNIHIDNRRVLLEAVKTHIEQLRTDELKALSNKYKDPKVYRKYSKSIYNKYLPLVGRADEEIRNITPVICSCGNTVEYNENECSECGKTRNQIIDEQTKKAADDKLNKTLSVTALVCMVLGILFGAGMVKSIISGEFQAAFLIFTVILTAVFVVVINFKVRDYVVSLFPEKIQTNAAVIKALPAVTIAVPVILMIALGAMMGTTSNKKEESTLAVVTTGITEQLTDRATTSATSVTTTTVTTTETEKTTLEITTVAEDPTVEVTEEIIVDAAVEEIEQPELPVEESEEDDDPNARIIVYKTKTGKKYHYDNNCNGAEYYECTLSEALAAGLEPCNKCVY